MDPLPNMFTAGATAETQCIRRERKKTPLTRNNSEEPAFFSRFRILPSLIPKNGPADNDQQNKKNQDSGRACHQTAIASTTASIS
jgi:hypothetical protein